MARKQDERERFWSKVDTTGDCWVWTASFGPGGYGQFWINNHLRRAHKISFEWANGPIVEGLVVDHACHNRACVRPEHLHAVTPKENAENRAGAQRNGTSGYRGVTWYPNYGKWMAHVTHEGRFVFCGYHPTREQAAEAAADKRRALFTNSVMDQVEVPDPVSIRRGSLI